MAADVAKSSHLKLWIVLGLFIGLLVGLIVYEVRVYIKAKEQRENIEATKDKVSKMINLGIQDSKAKDAAQADSSK